MDGYRSRAVPGAKDAPHGSLGIDFIADQIRPDRSKLAWVGKD